MKQSEFLYRRLRHQVYDRNAALPDRHVAVVPTDRRSFDISSTHRW